MAFIESGSKEFTKVNIALFAGGFSTFAVLYSTQPLLPYLSKEFHVSPAMASLSLSAATITLAVSLLLAGSLSEVWGRKSIMTLSMFSASVLAILVGLAPDFNILLGLRILQGFVLSGLSAIAMAYLSEEVGQKSLGIAMGMFISGNSLGGMFGRIIIGLLTDFFNWRIAICSVGFLSLAASILFVCELPDSRHFVPRKLEWGKLFKSMASHLRNAELLRLFGIGFLLLGSLVTMYNYISFQLLEPPYSLSPSIVGFIFVLYLSGTFSSAWMGHLSGRFGHKKVLLCTLLIMFAGVSLSLSVGLLVKIAGIALLTFGFFGGHSVASSWIGRLASHDKAQASSLYLFFYYTGSSIGGTLGGTLWATYGWHGVAGLIMLFVTLGIILTQKLSKAES